MVAAIRVTPSVCKTLSTRPLTRVVVWTNNLLTRPFKAATRAVSLLRTVQYAHPPNCPCHSNPGHHHHHAKPHVERYAERQSRRPFASALDASQQKEYAFEMASSSIRFGSGVTREVGMDLTNMGAKKVCVVTDSNVRHLTAMKHVEEALAKEGLEYKVFDKVRVEPKDSS
jgi:hydroxyacid-oxoacid transhydrogenase